MSQWREDFPELQRSMRGRDLVYLDSAATTLKPRAVIESMMDFYLHRAANVHRGAYLLSDEATEAFETARRQLASFLGAQSPAEIIFTKGTTEAVNLVAQAFAATQLEPGDEILLTEMEHHSNIVPWQMAAKQRGLKLKVVRVSDAGELDLESLHQQLSARSRLLAITHCSNVLGTVNPIREISQLVRPLGVRVFVDAAQSVSFTNVDVQDLGCDFLAFSGHKLFGPFGVGVLYGRSELLASMPPYQTGGSMIDRVSFAETTFLEPPQRYEAGTPPVAEVLGLGAAVQYLVGHPTKEGKQEAYAEIERHERQLLEQAKQALSEVPGIVFVGDSPTRVNILSFCFPGVHPSDIGHLLDQQGVALRVGHHCCQPLMQRYGIVGTVRASFSIYNNEQDVIRLAAAVRKAKELL